MALVSCCSTAATARSAGPAAPSMCACTAQTPGRAGSELIQVWRHTQICAALGQSTTHLARVADDRLGRTDGEVRAAAEHLLRGRGLVAVCVRRVKGDVEACIAVVPPRVRHEEPRVVGVRRPVQREHDLGACHPAASRRSGLPELCRRQHLESGLPCAAHTHAVR